jgi:hypothetical protein
MPGSSGAKPQAADQKWASRNVARAHCIAHLSAAHRGKMYGMKHGQGQ